MDGGEFLAPNRSGAVGHRTVPHTADLRVEAWAPTAEGCIAEAVRATVESFADTSGAAVAGERACVVTAGSGDDLLASVLEEVVYRLDADGEIPIGVDVETYRPEGGGPGLRVRFRMADTRTVRETGAVPKAVSLHGLRLRNGPGGWTCGVTLDV